MVAQNHSLCYNTFKYHSCLGVEMKNHQFDSNVENIYLSLSDEEKTKYKKQQDKFNKSFLVIGILIAVLFIATAIALIFIIGKDYVYSIFVGMVLLLGICGIIIWIIKPCVIGLKSNDETNIKMCIERLEKQKELANKETEKRLLADLQKNVYYKLSVDNIKLVTILDSYTEVSDKLHAVLNYQEIIQTRIYKFKVDYNDGTSKIITAPEGSEEYSLLITRVKSGTTSQTNSSDNNIEKLREYKQLLDDGIITQEEFDKKKNEFLSK